MYKKCFVACLDILGFKNFIDTHNATEITDSLGRLIELSKILTGARHSNPEPKIHPLLMSDTLLLFSEKHDEKSFNYITNIVANTICCGMNLSITNIPRMRFRGAISWGDFYYDDKESIFFGPAFNDAVYWKKNRNG